MIGDGLYFKAILAVAEFEIGTIGKVPGVLDTFREIGCYIELEHAFVALVAGRLCVGNNALGQGFSTELTDLGANQDFKRRLDGCTRGLDHQRIGVAIAGLG